MERYTFTCSEVMDIVEGLKLLQIKREQEYERLKNNGCVKGVVLSVFKADYDRIESLIKKLVLD